MLHEQRIPAFVEALGSAAPAPGGGAASALVAALAAALAEMVAQLTAGKPRFAAADAMARGVIARARGVREELLALLDADAVAYARVAEALRLPRGGDAERATRQVALEDAGRQALQPPLAIMERAATVLDLAREIAGEGNPAVVSDAGCAALLAEAALRAAALNVAANLMLLREATEIAALDARVAALEARAATSRDATLELVTLALVARRMGRAGPSGSGEHGGRGA